jgi:lipoprotein-anchoring transpeptidase ErfK/SrfK
LRRRGALAARLLYGAFAFHNYADRIEAGVSKMKLLAVFATAFLTLCLARPADAAVTVRISKSEQLMRVYVGEQLTYQFKVSTAAKGYKTPLGNYSIKRMHTMWYSRKYDNAPMPYALFFFDGWAVHGTTSVAALGRPASHGCIRLHPANARTLFRLVSSYGKASTRIVVTG